MFARSIILLSALGSLAGSLAFNRSLVVALPLSLAYPWLGSVGQSLAADFSVPVGCRRVAVLFGSGELGFATCLCGLLAQKLASTTGH